MWFGRWVDGRREETDEVTAPAPSKDKHPKMRVPRYETVSGLLGLTASDGSPAPDLSVTEADALADHLARNPADLADFLRTTTPPPESDS